MTMTFFHHDLIDISGAADNVGVDRLCSANSTSSIRDAFYFVRGKTEVPRLQNIIDRPRIHALLNRSAEQFPATLVSGRAGTGKTALAAAFANSRTDVAWYSLESLDQDWPIFCKYFSKLILADLPEALQETFNDHDPRSFSETDVAKYLLNGFAGFYRGGSSAPRLLVLDDIHHIFDAPWFDDFFNLLLYSLPAETHLIMLCRSKPPSPLWRLRSKQMLNVLDEKVIAFTVGETESLFSAKGLPIEGARDAHRSCYGRVSKLLQFADTIRSEARQIPA